MVLGTVKRSIDTGAILSLQLLTLPNDEDVNLFCLSLNQSLLFRWSLVETSLATASFLLTPTLLSMHCRVSGETFSSTSNYGIFSNNKSLLKLSSDFSWFFFWTVQLVSKVLFGSKLLPIKVAHNNWASPFFVKIYIKLLFHQFEPKEQKNYSIKPMKHYQKKICNI